MRLKAKHSPIIIALYCEKTNDKLTLTASHPTKLNWVKFAIQPTQTGDNFRQFLLDEKTLPAPDQPAMEFPLAFKKTTAILKINQKQKIEEPIVEPKKKFDPIPKFAEAYDYSIPQEKSTHLFQLGVGNVDLNVFKNQPNGERNNSHK